MYGKEGEEPQTVVISMARALDLLLKPLNPRVSIGILTSWVRIQLQVSNNSNRDFVCLKVKLNLKFYKGAQKCDLCDLL